MPFLLQLKSVYLFPPLLYLVSLLQRLCQIPDPSPPPRASSAWLVLESKTRGWEAAGRTYSYRPDQVLAYVRPKHTAGLFGQFYKYIKHIPSLVLKANHLEKGERFRLTLNTHFSEQLKRVCR